MKIKKLSLFLILASLLSVSCSDRNPLDNGTFKLFAEGKEMGKLYRKDNIQIECYFKDNVPFKTKYKKLNDSTYILQSYEMLEKVDTVQYLLTYRNLGNDTYSFIAKPLYLDINYSLSGKLKKISDEIENKKVSEIINKIKDESKSNKN